MNHHNRLRGLTDRFPQVLVSLCFYRELSGKEPKKAHKSCLHREKDPTHAKEYPGRLEKAMDRIGGQTNLRPGRPALPLSQSGLSSWTMPPSLLRINLNPSLRSVWSNGRRFLLTLLSAPICIPQVHGSCSFSLRVFPQGLSIYGSTKNCLRFSI